MSIKIPSGPPAGQPVEAATDATEAAADASPTTATTAQEPIGNDAVARIAEDVAAGRISGEDAVEQIIAETLGTSMVEQAPAELRTELADALRALIESDPQLRSLARGLGATKD